MARQNPYHHRDFADKTLPAAARNSVLLCYPFTVGNCVDCKWFQKIRTIGEGAKPISMAVVIQMMMLCFGGIILLATKTDPRGVPNGVVFKSGMVAAIIFSIAWMSDTYFQYAMPQFKSGIVEMVTNYPWTFALALFIVSVVVKLSGSGCTYDATSRFRSGIRACVTGLV